MDDSQPILAIEPQAPMGLPHEGVNRYVAAHLAAMDRLQCRIEFSVNGTIEDANENYLQLMGYTREELIGQHHRIFLHPAERDRAAYADFWRSLLAGDLHSGEFQRVARDGSVRWIQATYSPVVDDDGIIVKFVKYAQDLTARKEAERKANQARQQFDFHFRALDQSHGRMEFCVDGLITSVNDNFLRLMKYERHELIGKHHRVLLSPEDRRSTAEFWNGLLRGQFHSGEFLRLAKDGTRRWIQATYNPVFRDDGTIDKIVKYAIDVTARKEAGERIAILSAAVEQGSACVLISNRDGEVAYSNLQFRATTGLEGSIGKNLFSLLAGQDQGQLCDEIRKTVRAGEMWRGEIQMPKRDGSQFWAMAAVSPICDQDGVVSHFLAAMDDITDQKSLMNEMHELAYSDSLTGLPNRSAILEAVQESIDRGDSNRFALLFLDFDRFKLINDSLGHEAGDELLREISRRLKGNLRSSDNIVAARLGGDEFIVLLNDLAEWENAERVAARLLDVFAQSYNLNGHSVHSTASIGIVTSEHGYSSASEMVRHADLAMYEAKSAGKSCCVVFDKSMQEKAKSRLRLECELRDAIGRNDFKLYYQPIVSLVTGEVEGVEALVRWLKPDGTIVSPAEFIPIAEETGLVNDIGRWVIEEACQQLAIWRRDLGEHAPKCVHVNVSRIQMMMPNLLETIVKPLTRHDLPPECLHVEVTESVIMHDPCIIEAMRKLRELGVRIDMDDFGTGHSSLACLHEFPIDVLKIDRSFVNNVKEIRDYAAVLHAIVSLADNLGLKVVTEGIETEEQLATLQAMGCEFGQGFYFAKPLPADGLAKFVEQHSRQTAEIHGH